MRSHSHGSYTIFFEHEFLELHEYYLHADFILFNAHGSHRSYGSADASHGSRMSILVPR